MMGSKGGVGSLQHRETYRIEWWLHTVFNISLTPTLSDDLHKVFRWIGLRLLQTRTT